MNLKGLFDYDRVKLAKDNLESELLMAKLTATELTKENDELHTKVLELSREITDLQHELSVAKAHKASKEMRWEYVIANTIEGTLSCWLPTNGTAKELLHKYPAIFPEFLHEKRVPEL